MNQNNNKTNTTTMEGVQNMNKNTRLTEAMHWGALRNKYFIGEVVINGKSEKINQLAEAIEAGELDALAQECADTLHNGNLYQMYLAWNKTLSSTQTHMKKRDFDYSENTRYTLLRHFVTQRMTELKGAYRAGNSKAYWMYTLEEIEALPIEDLATVESVYNGLSSKRSKKPEAFDAINDDYYTRFDAIAAKRAAARAYAKRAHVEISEPLLAKLTKGSSAVLTKAEAAQLAELIQQLNK